MPDYPLKTVKIAAGTGDVPLTKAQKTFNAHIERLEKLRALRAAWDTAIAAFQHKYAGELHPLIEESTALQIQFAHRLDQAHGQARLTERERRTLAGLIAELAADLLDERDDEALKALYRKHAGSDFDDLQAAELAETKAMLEEMLGIELGDDLEMGSPEEVMQRARERMDADAHARELRRATKKKTPRQLAREARQRAEEAQVGLSIREIYRKLASALHPDREPDPEERDRKTALMQRVNRAYDAKNLLQLLELQLEVEHLGRNTSKDFGEDRLLRYNHILKDQIRDLEQEIGSVEGEFRARFGIAPMRMLTPVGLVGLIDDDIRRVRHGMREMARDMKMCDDDEKLKAWLKKLKRRARARDVDEDW